MGIRILLFVFLMAQSLLATPPTISWVNWTPDLFEKATQQKKLVILDLEAVWCHWCHVMEKQTYSDPKIIDLISKNFIAVRVDQDARPDISRRYEDYGWPATIFFNAKGQDLAKRSGYLDKKEMQALLEKLIKSPVPEEDISHVGLAVPETPFFSKTLKEKLLKSHAAQYDNKNKGWGSIHKFLFGETEEFALRNAWRRDKDDTKRVKETLTAAIALIDPEWGGAYQYSVKTWNEKHFEKIAQAQKKNLILYSAGYSLFNDPKYLKAANDIRKFLNGFLKSPTGAYYTSQDADLVKGVHSDKYFSLSDKQRRAQGVPAIDKHIYSRENGGFIQGLVALYSVTGEKEILDEAITAAKEIEKTRSLRGGGFSHDEKDAAGPYLGDTVAMGKAFLDLYQATGDLSWLEKSKAASSFIQKTFSHKESNKDFGFVSSATPIAGGLNADLDKDENIQVARLTNLLFHYTGETAFKKTAEQAMTYLASPTLVKELPTGGQLLVEEELTSTPVHLTVVGSKKDPAAAELFKSAQAYPVTYKRMDWYDKSQGKLPNMVVEYPDLPKAAVFACREGRCSAPFFDPKELRAKVDKLYSLGKVL